LENVRKCLTSSLGRGYAYLLFLCLRVREQKKVENRCSKRFNDRHDQLQIDELSQVVRVVQPRVILSKHPITTSKVLECLQQSQDQTLEANSTTTTTAATTTTTTSGLTMTQLFSAAAFTCGSFIRCYVIS